MNYEEAALINNESIQKFELIIDGYRSFIEYKVKGDRIYLMHTEVPKELAGKGIAGILVRKAFEQLEKDGAEVVPQCSYILHFLKRNPEWNRIVEEDHRNG